MKFVQVCPTRPMADGSCPEPLIWQELTQHVGLTYPEFLQILPHLVGMLLAALAIRWTLRLIWNNR